jgi:hypothetical protein
VNIAYLSALQTKWLDVLIMSAAAHAPPELGGALERLGLAPLC